MAEFRPDLNRFPKITDSGLTKRQIAERAGDDKAFDLVEKAYEIYPEKMSNVWSLYFVSPVSHPEVTKIGIAVDPYERLRGLQCGCWDELNIFALFWFPHHNTSASLEYAALSLARREGVRLKGEWVNLDWKEAVGLTLTADTEKVLRYTDSHGLINEWLPEVSRQWREAEDAFYSRTPSKAA